MTAQEKLSNRIGKNYHICVGLDTDINKIPKHLLASDDPIYEFNKGIIEATSSQAAAYKINLAFYESRGLDGLRSLEKTLEMIPREILSIGDAKRGDIGNTSKMYAQSLFDHFGFDASTLHPYMGKDSLQPFLEFNEKLNFILVLTSNPGNADFEKQKLEDGRYLYQEVLQKVHNWNENKNCGIVFGATNIEELKSNLSHIKNLPVLLPGVGAQGGSLEDVVKAFALYGSENYLINISRGLIYADSSENFAKVTAAKLQHLNEEIYLNKYISD